jgi:CHAT domain-containing protein
VLIVAKEYTSGYARLRHARDEAFCIERIIFDQGHFLEKNTEVDESPLIANITPKLPEATIAHFACHASVSENLSQSGIVLDRMLPIDAISQMRLQSGALAYLSACNTALSKAAALSDESITLCSAFLVAGFAKVIGTLWKSEDCNSFEVAEKFYEALGSDVSRSQIALHEAISFQRDARPGEPSLWAGYIFSGG